MDSRRCQYSALNCSVYVWNHIEKKTVFCDTASWPMWTGRDLRGPRSRSCQWVEVYMVDRVFEQIDWVRFNVPLNTLYRSYLGRFYGSVTQPTVSEYWRKIGPKDWASIPSGPPPTVLTIIQLSSVKQKHSSDTLRHYICTHCINELSVRCMMWCVLPQLVSSEALRPSVCTQSASPLDDVVCS